MRRVDEDLHRERGDNREGLENILKKRPHFSHSVNNAMGEFGANYTLQRAKERGEGDFSCMISGKLALDVPVTIECQAKVPRPGHSTCTQYNWDGSPIPCPGFDQWAFQHHSHNELY